MNRWINGLFLTAALCSVPTLRAADKPCSAATLQGSFGYTVTGFAPGLAPFAAVGRIVFDGSGLVTTTRTLSNNGVIIRGDIASGTYTVGDNCTGTLTISATGLGQLNLDIVVDDGGDQLRGIVTNAGFVLTLEGRRQSKK
jgi:hypothetical protein